jgi:hypothetical protein
VLTYAYNILENPALGGYLRKLRFSSLFWEFREYVLGEELNLSRCIARILSHSPRLTCIRLMRFSEGVDNVEDVWDAYRPCTFIINSESFVELANTAGPVLDTLDDVFIHTDSQGSQDLCPSIFGQFSALRSWRCCITARFITDTTSISPSYLSTLEFLRLQYCHTSLLDVLSCMQYVTSIIQSPLAK